MYVSEYEFRQAAQFENVRDEVVAEAVASATVDKAQLENRLQEKYEAELRRRPRAQWTRKEHRNDGVQNEEIRALTIAAYLRCLYAAIEYAPTKNLRQFAIEAIRDPAMFKAIT